MANRFSLESCGLFPGYVNSICDYIAVGSDADLEIMEDNGNVLNLIK